MKATILENGNLQITVDQETQAHLAQLKEEDPNFGSDSMMTDVFESLTCNSEYQWGDASMTGDLTDAPMLMIFGESIPGDPEKDGGRAAGAYPDAAGVFRTWIEPVEQRWGFMDYCLRSPQDDLADQGYCIFQSGN